MRNVLIVSKKKDIGDALAKLLRPFKFDHIDITDSAQEARRKVQRGSYSLVLINTPLSHEIGTDLALDVLSFNDPDVILLVQNDALPRVEMKLANAPILIVQKPINKQLILRELNYIINSQEKREKLIEQNSRLKDKMNDLKNLFRAKLFLMEHLNMSEAEAHRYIQKKAMDERRTPGQVAKGIISIYDKKNG